MVDIEAPYHVPGPFWGRLSFIGSTRLGLAMPFASEKQNAHNTIQKLVERMNTSLQEVSTCPFSSLPFPLAHSFAPPVTLPPSFPPCEEKGKEGGDKTDAGSKEERD